MDRKVVFKALVGSHNYSLNIENSDKDYKVFVLPNFEDLYEGTFYSHNTTSLTEDLEFHDIRKCTNLWYKSNINYLEVLFSEEFIIGTELNARSRDIINELLSMRDEIAKMNLPYLYNACIGQCLQTGKKVMTKYLANRGFDSKQASTCIRLLLFLIRFANSNFNDFKSSIYYKNGNNRNLILIVKKGEISYEEFQTLSSLLFDMVEKEIKPLYMEKSFNIETKNRIKELLHELVRINL